MQLARLVTNKDWIGWFLITLALLLIVKFFLRADYQFWLGAGTVIVVQVVLQIVLRIKDRNKGNP